MQARHLLIGAAMASLLFGAASAFAESTGGTASDSGSKATLEPNQGTPPMTGTGVGPAAGVRPGPAILGKGPTSDAQGAGGSGTGQGSGSSSTPGQGSVPAPAVPTNGGR